MQSAGLPARGLLASDRLPVRSRLFSRWFSAQKHDRVRTVACGQTRRAEHECPGKSIRSSIRNPSRRRVRGGITPHFPIQPHPPDAFVRRGWRYQLHPQCNDSANVCQWLTSPVWIEGVLLTRKGTTDTFRVSDCALPMRFSCPKRGPIARWISMPGRHWF